MKALFGDECEYSKLKKSRIIDLDRSLSKDELDTRNSKKVLKPTISSTVTIIKQNGAKHDRNSKQHHWRRSNNNAGYETKSNRDHDREINYRDLNQDSNNKSKSTNCYIYAETLKSTVNIVPSKKSYYQQSQKRDYHREERDYHYGNKPSRKQNYKRIDNNDLDFIEDRKMSHKNDSSDKYKKKNLRRNVDVIDETYHKSTKRIKTEDVPNKKSKQEDDSNKHSKNSQHTLSSSLQSNESLTYLSSLSPTSTVSESDLPYLEKNSIKQLTVENNDYIATDIDQIKTEVINNDKTPKISTPSLLINSNDNTKSTNVEDEDNLMKYHPSYEGCRSVETFTCLNRIAEGTYGVVYRAKDRKTNEIVALKRLKIENDKGFPITSLREINTLLKGQHPNIVRVREIVVGSNMDKIFIVMDYVEQDMKLLMDNMRLKGQVFLQDKVKYLLKQLLSAIAHLHDNWILHRDLKMSNLLLSRQGILKVGDFGLAREYDSPLKPYTPIVVTLWYRAPELLLGSKLYSTPIDLWSIGCIFAELLTMNPLFPGRTEMDQINLIFKDLGTPNERIWPGCSNFQIIRQFFFIKNSKSQIRTRINSMTTKLGLNLLMKFLTYDPKQRITAEDALNHQYFEEQPIKIETDMFPTCSDKNPLDHVKDVDLTSPESLLESNEFKINNKFLLNYQPIGAGFNLKF